MSRARRLRDRAVKLRMWTAAIAKQLGESIEAPAPVTQEEVVHMPKVMHRERSHNSHVEKVVDIVVAQQCIEETVRVAQEAAEAATSKVKALEERVGYADHELACLREELRGMRWALVAELASHREAKKVDQQHGELTDEEHAPVTQDNIVHIPTIIPQERITQQHVEQVVQAPVPMKQEEIVHAPKMMMQKRAVQRSVLYSSR